LQIQAHDAGLVNKNAYWQYLNPKSRSDKYMR